jgi:hypothetical protein
MRWHWGTGCGAGAVGPAMIAARMAPPTKALTMQVIDLLGE